MKRHLALVTLLAGCPSDDPANTLWLAPTNGEQNVLLQEKQPNPY
jgi:hypothetical protein